MLQRTRSLTRDWFHIAPILFLTTAAMLLDLIICTIGLLTDHTLITGAPAWDKPMKFALSTGIYALSVITIVRWTSIWRKLLQIVAGVTSFVLVLEVGCIDLQAFRHTTSHFNIATSFDTTVYTLMGVGVGTVWLASIVLAVATFFQKYGDRSFTTAVRAGMVLIVLGAGTGALMVRPTPAQQKAQAAGQHVTVVGAHSVGGIDGGKGLPFLGWSTQYGDIRVAHFLGLHALQILVLLALCLSFARLEMRQKVWLISITAVSYGVLFLMTLLEALAGLPITDYSAPVLSVWAAWGVASFVAFAMVLSMQKLRVSNVQESEVTI